MRLGKKSVLKKYLFLKIMDLFENEMKLCLKSQRELLSFHENSSTINTKIKYIIL